MKLLFVCTGNTCRSPMAAHILRLILEEKGLSEHVSIASAGLAAFEGDTMAPRAQEVLKDLWDIDGSGHLSQGLSIGLLRDQDMILTMTSDQSEQLKKQLPEMTARISTLMEAVIDSKRTLDRLHQPHGQKDDSIYANLNHGDIADPFGQSYDVYEGTARLLREYLTILADFLATRFPA